MNVNLLHSTPLYVAVQAARKCYDSMDKSDSGCNVNKQSTCLYCLYSNEPQCDEKVGDKDKALLKALIKNNHTSVLEHISFTFDIEGISLTCLNQLERHRVASPSVMSTRYTLKKTLNDTTNTFNDVLVKTNSKVDVLITKHLIEILDFLEENPDTPNDILKYALPEAFKTSLIWSINARSLRNFLALRMAPKALQEIRELAEKIYSLVCDNGYGILFEDIVNIDKEEM